MFKVNNKDTRMTHMWTYFTPCSNVSIVNLEQVNAGWVNDNQTICISYKTATISTWNRQKLAQSRYKKCVNISLL